MEENESTFVPVQLDMSAPPTKFIDWCGHGSQKLRLQPHYEKAKAIIFVVDATDAASSSLSTIAQFLFAIFSELAITSRRVPILIACNKTDVDSAKTMTQIKAGLESMVARCATNQDTVADVLTFFKVVSGVLTGCSCLFSSSSSSFKSDCAGNLSSCLLL